MLTGNLSLAKIYHYKYTLKYIDPINFHTNTSLNLQRKATFVFSQKAPQYHIWSLFQAETILQSKKDQTF